MGLQRDRIGRWPLALCQSDGFFCQLCRIMPCRSVGTLPALFKTCAGTFGEHILICMTDSLLTRRPHTPRPALTVWEDMSLTLGRVHEFCGLSRRMLALMIAGHVKGPIIWLTSGRPVEGLNPDGAMPYANISDFNVVTCRRADEALWSMEEVLRAGCVPLVIADMDQSLALTPIRRLNLAAEAGSGKSQQRPLGIVLTPGEGGSSGVESRWRLEPRHQPDGLRWRLDRLRARTAPLKRWSLIEHYEPAHWNGSLAPNGPRLGLHPYSESMTQVAAE